MRAPPMPTACGTGHRGPCSAVRGLQDHCEQSATSPTVQRARDSTLQKHEGRNEPRPVVTTLVF